MSKSFNIRWKEKELYIGKEHPIAINQLVGINTIEQYDECVKKIDMWDDDSFGPDIITDVSLYVPDNHSSIWQYALQKGKYIVATVPIYHLKNKTKLEKDELLYVIEKLFSSGVKIITIHPTVSLELMDLSRSRMTPMTSRGGGIVARDMINNQAENIYVDNLDEIAELSVKYDAVISIGTAYRPANIFDSMDLVHRKEIQKQFEIAEYLNQKNVKVMLEMPGHTSPKKIQELNSLLSRNTFPIMPLGPVVTDVGIGMDHITSSIGQILLGKENNVQVISAMTAEEHTGNIPSIQSTREAIKTARLVAHILDMDKFDDYSLDFDIAKKRRHSCIIGDETEDCGRCGGYCPLKIGD